MQCTAKSPSAASLFVGDIFGNTAKRAPCVARLFAAMASEHSCQINDENARQKTFPIRNKKVGGRHGSCQWQLRHFGTDFQDILS